MIHPFSLECGFNSRPVLTYCNFTTAFRHCTVFFRVAACLHTSLAKVQYGGGCQQGVKWDGREYSVPDRSIVRTHTHTHACTRKNTHTQKNTQTRLLPKQTAEKKRKKPLTWQNKGGKKAYVTLQRGTDHIWVHTPTVEWQMIISVPCGSLERNLLKEWKWMWLSSEQSPDVSALTFSFFMYNNLFRKPAEVKVCSSADDVYD